MGQSNQSGYITHTAPFSGLPQVSFYVGDQERVFMPGNTSSDFPPGDTQLRAGPEFGIANGLAPTGLPVWMAKAAVGGTPITAAMPGGVYNAQFIAAMGVLTANTKESTPVYLVQRSGEKESANLALADMVATAEADFLSYARGLASGRTVFLICVITNPNILPAGYPNVDMVRNGLMAAVAADARAASYAPTWVPTYNPHDDGDQQDSIGASVAAIILQHSRLR
jgi:hypothetical protein